MASTRAWPQTMKSLEAAPASAVSSRSSAQPAPARTNASRLAWSSFCITMRGDRPWRSNMSRNSRCVWLPDGPSSQGSCAASRQPPRLSTAECSLGMAMRYRTLRRGSQSTPRGALAAMVSAAGRRPVLTCSASAAAGRVWVLSSTSGKR
ncbi:hypothetical protein D3C87_1592550 [compost metagenome]